MALEIEHKFLVHTDRLPEGARTGGAAIEQGYLSFDPAVRVRVKESEGTTRAWITVKGRGLKTRAEFEYAIPTEDARAMLTLCTARIHKVRREIEHAGHCWEIDEFQGAHQGLWLAEIEIDREDETFERPAWLDREVTEDPRYTNAELARTGCVP